MTLYLLIQRNKSSLELNKLHYTCIDCEIVNPLPTYTLQSRAPWNYPPEFYECGYDLSWYSVILLFVYVTVATWAKGPIALKIEK